MGFRFAVDPLWTPFGALNELLLEHTSSVGDCIVRVESETEVPAAASIPSDVRKGQPAELGMAAEHLVGEYLSSGCIDCCTSEVVGCAAVGHTGLFVVQNMPIELPIEPVLGPLLGPAVY